VAGKKGACFVKVMMMLWWQIWTVGAFGPGNGRSTGLGARARGARNKLRVSGLWRRTFISRSAGWAGLRPAGGRRWCDAKVVMRSSGGHRVLGCGRKGCEDGWTGLEKFGALAAMVRRRACACFAIHAAKESGRGSLTCSQEPRGHCAESPTRESRLRPFGTHYCITPTLSILVPFQPDLAQPITACVHRRALQLDRANLRFFRRFYQR
jgi:hypothetical protein